MTSYRCPGATHYTHMSATSTVTIQALTGDSHNPRSLTSPHRRLLIPTLRNGRSTTWPASSFQPATWIRLNCFETRYCTGKVRGQVVGTPVVCLKCASGCVIFDAVQYVCKMVFSQLTVLLGVRGLHRYNYC